jgi:hypothetical protein
MLRRRVGDEAGLAARKVSVLSSVLTHYAHISSQRFSAPCAAGGARAHLAKHLNLPFQAVVTSCIPGLVHHLKQFQQYEDNASVFQCCDLTALWCLTDGMHMLHIS